MNQRHLQNASHVSLNVNLILGNVNQKKSNRVKKAIKTIKQQYNIWNPRICAFKCDKNFEVGEYLKKCLRMIENTSKSNKSY